MLHRIFFLKNLLVGGFFIFLTLGMLAACSQEETPPLRLGTNVWPGYEPLYLARALGQFDDTPVKLVEFLSASEVIRAFRNKSLEAAALTLDEVLVLLKSNIPVKIVAVMDISDGGDVILGQPGITTFEELKGKRLGVEGSALGAYVVARALKLNGMKTSDLEIVHLQVSEHEKAFNEREIDGVATFEPVRTKLTNMGATELFTSREIPGEIVDVLIVHSDYVKNNKTAVKTLINGWFMAIKHLKAKPAEAAVEMARRLDVTPEEVLQSYEGLILPDRAENSRMISARHPSLKATAVQLQKVMMDNNLLVSAVDIDSLFAPGIID